VPLIDIVVDTNVWMHAQMPGQKRMGRSVALCRALLEGQCLLRVDDGFQLDEARNTSMIGSEYHAHLRFDRNPGKIAVETIAALLRTRRVRSTPIALERSSKKLLDQLIHDSIDRRFVRVAANSSEHILVTHDWEDFTAGKRKQLTKKTGVKFVDAGVAL
jgi:predicted nucleic acid-binding protein